MQGEQSGPGWRAPICIPSGQQAPAAGPPAVWEDRWGAIAQDEKTGMTGLAKEQKSESQATKAAISDCIQGGGLNCKIIFTYGNECVAIAAGAPGSGFARNSSLNDAKNQSINSCNKHSSTPCKVVYTDCSLPIRIQ